MATPEELNYHLKAPVRTNQFNVINLFPPILGVTQNKIRQSKALVKSIETPDMPIGEIVMYTGGKPVKYAGDRQYNDVTVTFRIDRDFSIYEQFKRWSDFIVGIATQSAASQYTDYTSQILIQSVYLTGSIEIPTQSWNIIGAWPKDISKLAYDRDQENQAAEFTVTFSCNSFTCINLRTI
jgi:T4-like virus tail tube protein gp19